MCRISRHSVAQLSSILSAKVTLWRAESALVFAPTFIGGAGTMGNVNGVMRSVVGLGRANEHRAYLFDNETQIDIRPYGDFDKETIEQTPLSLNQPYASLKWMTARHEKCLAPPKTM